MAAKMASWVDWKVGGMADYILGWKDGCNKVWLKIWLDVFDNYYKA